MKRAGGEEMFSTLAPPANFVKLEFENVTRA